MGEVGKDQWDRFERAVDQLAKTPPMHRKKEPKKSSRPQSRASKKRGKRETGDGSS